MHLFEKWSLEQNIIWNICNIYRYNIGSYIKTRHLVYITDDNIHLAVSI